MGTKAKFTATFADGTTITRTSEHAYTVAWRASWTDDKGCKLEITGFAVSREKARPEKPRAFIFRGMSSARRAEEKRAHDEFMARNGYAVEFAEAVSA